MARRRVLIVDDEADVRETVKFALEHEGIECLEAADGATGLALARHENPDLILLDIMLPGVDGYKISRLLKFDHAYRRIPIIMVTAKSQAEDVKLGEETGADGYVTKPFNMDALIGVVKDRLAAAIPAKRVLIVDDDPDIVKSVRFALQREDIKCLEAENGKEAIEVARRERPDLILLDIMLPDTSGHRVARALKRDTSCKNTPIVMLTALSQQDQVGRASEVGADGYVTKPFEINALVDVVRKFLDKKLVPAE